VAVSDPGRTIAFPLETRARRSKEEDARYFREIVRREEVAGIVVGLPVHADGREGVKAAEARAYGRWLAEVTGRPVSFFDERYTTVQAEEALWDAGLTHKKRKERRDRVAAQMLLQGYLEAGCPADEAAGPLEG
jgi:putative Holliday junction resolvase